MPRSLISSAQSGMAKRTESRAESRNGGELEGLEEWQAQGNLGAGVVEGLRSGEGEKWNLESIFGEEDGSVRFGN